MTIKEMTKLYKKIEKAINEYGINKYEIDRDNIYQDDPESMIAHAKAYAKSIKTLNAIAEGLNISVKIVASFNSEEYFCKYCLLNDIEYNETAETEE